MEFAVLPTVKPIKGIRKTQTTKLVCAECCVAFHDGLRTTLKKSSLTLETVESVFARKDYLFDTLEALVERPVRILDEPSGSRKTFFS